MVLQLKRSLLCPLTWLLAACLSGPAASGQVRPGVEVLLTDSLHLVRGRRLGLLTNQNGIDRAGRSDVDLLRAAGLDLKVIFSPEHGFRGQLDRENIENTVDSATGASIFSLYGSIRAPTPAMLALIDVLLVDLQDIGGRPYTFISTTLLSMRAAAEEGKTVILLDRPNPIGGELVQGPALDSALTSYNGMIPGVPLRHGMTLGELARLGNGVLGIGAELVVAPAAGWRRTQWYEATGLPWVKPSPNMPDIESATHYPGLVLFEATNLSVGRGTPISFQVLGAPWLDPRKVREMVGAVPGVRLTDTTITPHQPTDAKFPGQPVAALRFKVTNRSLYDPTRLSVRLLSAIIKLHPDSLTLRDGAYDYRAGTERVRRALLAGESADSIWAAWQPGLDAFVRKRRGFLLYP